MWIAFLMKAATRAAGWKGDQATSNTVNGLSPKSAAQSRKLVPPIAARKRIYPRIVIGPSALGF